MNRPWEVGEQNASPATRLCWGDRCYQSRQPSMGDRTLGLCLLCAEEILGR